MHYEVYNEIRQRSRRYWCSYNYLAVLYILLVNTIQVVYLRVNHINKKRTILSFSSFRDPKLEVSSSDDNSILLLFKDFLSFIHNEHSARGTLFVSFEKKRRNLISRHRINSIWSSNHRQFVLLRNTSNYIKLSAVSYGEVLAHRTTWLIGQGEH